MEPLIGRKEELAKLRSLLDRQRSDFVAVYGRRRVGKTFLIRHAFEQDFSLHLTGLANSDTAQQLNNFHSTLVRYAPKLEDLPVPKDWYAAFRMLISYLESLPAGKKVVFIDELPWLDTPKSNFISAIEAFWNGWADNRSDILLVVCGSAASWMIHELLMNTGGLYNRVNHRIRLDPFTLGESEQFFLSKGAAFNRYQLVQLYMVFGGIPFYLEQIEVGKSALQNINELCFSQHGMMRVEFKYLYASLFSKSENHIAIVEALSSKAMGLTRDELLKKAQMANGGTATKILLELEECHFIRRFRPFGKKARESLYQLCDPYSFFYLRFIRNADAFDNYVWGVDVPDFNAWSGYAFEQVCLLHIPQIKQALEINGVITSTSSWLGSAEGNKVQIDLIIERRDQVIHLCEMKFSVGKYTVTKSYAEQLREKISTFIAATGTRKAVFLTFISTYGLATNEHAHGLVQNSITLDDLF
jgi:uncharacterized protein